jgi:hypothetical protein
MPARPVEGYILGWHPKVGCAFRVQPDGGGMSKWIRVPPADLAALASIFRESPVYIQEDGSITTGPEAIDGLD